MFADSIVVVRFDVDVSEEVVFVLVVEVAVAVVEYVVGVVGAVAVLEVTTNGCGVNGDVVFGVGTSIVEKVGCGVGSAVDCGCGVGARVVEIVDNGVGCGVGCGVGRGVIKKVGGRGVGRGVGAAVSFGVGFGVGGGGTTVVIGGGVGGHLLSVSGTQAPAAAVVQARGAVAHPRQLVSDGGDNCK